MVERLTLRHATVTIRNRTLSIRNRTLSRMQILWFEFVASRSDWFGDRSVKSSDSRLFVFRRYIFIRLCFCAFLLSLFVQNSQAAPTVREILRAMEEYEQEINSLSVVYGIRSSPDWKFKNIEAATECSWTWIQSGRRKLLKNERPDNVDQKTFARVWDSFDGSTGYSLVFLSSEGALHRIQETPFEPTQIGSREDYKHALGWGRVQSNSIVTVYSLLRKAGNSIVVEEDEIDGIKYPKVSLGVVFPPAIPGGPSHEVIVWFSPRHGLLPKRIAAIPERTTTPNAAGVVVLPPGSEPFFVDVLEYREVEDRLFKKTRWFPQRFQVRSMFSAELTTRSVSINEEIPVATFIPEKPIGTEIAKLTTGSTLNKISYVGGEEGERIYRDRMRSFQVESGASVANSPVNSAGGNAKPVDASPSNGVSVRLWFGIGALLFLGLAIVAARRRFD